MSIQNIEDQRYELVEMSAIAPHPQNPRRGDLDAIRESIRANGFYGVCIVQRSTGHILAGNHRYEAARLEGFTQVPVAYIDVDDEQALRILLADNRTADLGTYDEERLGDLLQSIRAGEDGLTGTGYDEAELGRLLRRLGRDTAESADVLPERVPAVTQMGDLWRLGRHRLLCGDSTDPEVVARVMAGQKAALFETDPPYVVGYTGHRPSRSTGEDVGKDWTDVYHEVDIPDVRVFYEGFMRAALPHLREDAAWYLWHGHKWSGLVMDLWDALGVLTHQSIVWVKPSPMFSTAYFNWRHEQCLFGWREGHRPDWSDVDLGAKTTSVWEVSYDGDMRKQQKEHPTQKPVELFAIPMRIHTKPGDVCFEPFCGSGTQIIAAETTERTCYAIEIEPHFVDLAIRRFEELTGVTAVKEES